MVRVYPADKQGYCMSGFCPTICEKEEAEQVAYDLAAAMLRHGFKFDNIIIEED